MIVLDKSFDRERVLVRITIGDKTSEEFDYPDVVRIEVITK